MNPHASSGLSLLLRRLRPALLLVPLAVALPAASAYQAGYAYDDAGRLVQADYGGGQTIAYATDANGNLTTRSAVAGLGPYALAYAAQPGGLLVGDAAQSVAHGGTGTAVVAAPQLHYAFVGWSDGFGNAERTDSNVVANLSVVARFVPLLAAGGLVVNWMICGILILFLIPFIEKFFGVTTRIHLQDLSGYEHPILKRLILEAPGTYHHSSIVSTLAEAGADAIGADGLKARIGGLYHDIGKLHKPEYFTENEAGVSRHQNLNPNMSALLIINHVRDGAELARSFRLP